MEYINIISKEEITETPIWIIYLLGGLALAAVLSSLVCWIIVKDAYKVAKYELIVGSSAVGLFVIGSIICSVFYRIPTGEYKYEATIDKDKITISQYEEFIEKYNPTIKDGVYYWED